MPVAALEDLVQGKLSAWSDPTRRESKRSKDESDLLRLGESHLRIVPLLPLLLRERLERQDRRGDRMTDDD